MLNRAAVMVRPKQPFIDWATGVDDAGLTPDEDDESTVYLVPAYTDEDEAWEILEEVYETIFETELDNWHSDEAAWPQERNFETFQAWFEIELHAIVEDLCDYEIVEEEEGEDED
jgi:hypothetical protein